MAVCDNKYQECTLEKDKAYLYGAARNAVEERIDLHTPTTDFSYSPKTTSSLPNFTKYPVLTVVISFLALDF